MDLLDLLGKLAAEHGSAAVRADHIALLRDEIILLQNRLAECVAGKAALDAENKDIKSKLELAENKRIRAGTPPQGKLCPFCNRHTLRLTEITPSHLAHFAALGVKYSHYKCENPVCGKVYDEEHE